MAQSRRLFWLESRCASVIASRSHTEIYSRRWMSWRRNTWWPQVMDAPPCIDALLCSGGVVREHPEVGALDKPKLVFFFDEATSCHRSPKRFRPDRQLCASSLEGVGVSRHPESLDIPETVLVSRHRVQQRCRLHPARQKAVKAAAETMAANPDHSEKAITGSGVGEALVSFLPQGRPRSSIERRASPGGRIGPRRRERQRVIADGPRRSYDKPSIASRRRKSRERRSARLPVRWRPRTGWRRADSISTRSGASCPAAGQEASLRRLQRAGEPLAPRSVGKSPRACRSLLGDVAAKGALSPPASPGAVIDPVASPQPEIFPGRSRFDIARRLLNGCASDE